MVYSDYEEKPKPKNVVETLLGVYEVNYNLNNQFILHKQTVMVIKYVFCSQQ